MANTTQILSQIESGDPSAAEQLLPLVYEELRKLAVEALGLPQRTAERKWTDARTWLHRETEKTASIDGPRGD